MHQRLGLAGELAGGRLVLPQACAQLHAQDAGDGVVDAGLRDFAGLHLGDGVGDEGLPCIRHHHHVDAGVDRLRAAVVLATGHLADAVPVGHHEAVEAHLLLQGHGQQVAGAVHLAVVLAGGDVVPAVERGHHRLHAGLDGTVVPLPVHVDHLRLRDQRIALVLAAVGGAVADEMLGGGDHVAVLVQQPLHALDVGGRVFADQRGLGGIALVGASPARVLRDRDGRRERPGHAGGARGLAGGLGDALDQFDVMRGAQADVVREDGGAVDVAVSVHGIGAPDHRHRDLRIRAHRGVVVGIGQRDPILHAGVLVLGRPGTATVQHRADVVLAHFLRCDRLDLRLHHLTDFLLQRHAGQDFGHAGLDGRVLREPAFQCRPVLQLGGGIRGGDRRGFGILLAGTRQAGQQAGPQQGHSDRLHSHLPRCWRRARGPRQDLHGAGMADGTRGHAPHPVRYCGTHTLCAITACSGSPAGTGGRTPCIPTAGRSSGRYRPPWFPCDRARWSHC